MSVHHKERETGLVDWIKLTEGRAQVGIFWKIMKLSILHKTEILEQLNDHQLLKKSPLLP
jgi:hypothetical protein